VRARNWRRWVIGLVVLLGGAGTYGMKHRATARPAQAGSAVRITTVPERAGLRALATWLRQGRRAPEVRQEAPAIVESAPRLDAEAPYRELPLDALNVALGRAPTREEQAGILAARHQLASDNAAAYLRLREGELDWDAYAAMLADHDQEFQHTLERLLRTPGGELRVLTGL
jgi:hypothetical protein